MAKSSKASGALAVGGARKGKITHELSGNAQFYQRIRKGETMENMGLYGTPGDVARLNGRYRLAREFKEGVFVDYSPRTAANYSALIRIHLTYSALELFVKVYGGKIEGLASVPELKAPIESMVEQLKLLDPDHRFMDVVGNKLDGKKLPAKLKADVSKGRIDPVRAIQAVRHVFVHGSLAANPTDLDDVEIDDYCRILADFWLDAVDRLFLGRVQQG